MAAHNILSEEQAAEERRAQKASTATDKVKGIPHALVKAVYGAEGARTFVTDAAPFPVTVATAVSGAIVAPKFARIDQATTSSTEIVAAVSAKKIRVVAFALFTSDSTIREFSLLSATTEIATYWIIKDLGLILIPSSNGYFETAANEALNLKQTAATPIAGTLVYTEV